MFNKKLLLLFTINLSAIAVLPISPSLAEKTLIPPPSDAPLQLELLTKPGNSVITANTIKPEKLTVPSLWRVKESTENKLLDNWLAFPAADKEPARVDLLVNQQMWSLLDYLERYDFVNRLGNAVRQDNYNLRVFNYQQELLAAYTCNFNSSPALCNIQMSSQSKLGWRRSF